MSIELGLVVAAIFLVAVIILRITVLQRRKANKTATERTMKGSRTNGGHHGHTLKPEKPE